MLRVDQVHVIRHKVLVEEKSARQVAREMGVSRNTIRKYLAQSEPRRTEKTRRPRPVFDQVKDHIDELLEDWGRRTARKQRITGTRFRSPAASIQLCSILHAPSRRLCLRPVQWREKADGRKITLRADSAPHHHGHDIAVAIRLR